MKCPCKDCRERRAGDKDTPPCHAGCENYAAWKAERDAIKGPLSELRCANTRYKKDKRVYYRMGVTE